LFRFVVALDITSIDATELAVFGKVDAASDAYLGWLDC
jgi:hypothetical protein